MIKKTIAFTNLDGIRVHDDFYFNMTMMDAAKLAVSHGGDYAEHIRVTMGRNNPKQILEMFEELIHASVGQRSADGNYFNRSDEITQRFVNSEAYTEFVLELMRTPGAAIEFFNGVMPLNFEERAKEFGGVQAASQERAATAQGFEVVKERRDPDGTRVVEKIIPHSLSLDPQSNAGNVQVVDEDPRPKWLIEDRQPTHKELQKMSKDEMSLAFIYRDAPPELKKVIRTTGGMPE